VGCGGSGESYRDDGVIQARSSPRMSLEDAIGEMVKGLKRLVYFFGFTL
jgi:hypothetical protein